MPKMSAIDLKALLSAERYDALSAMAASKLSDERASALNYYMGDMSKDMPAPDGRSKAVSSDVADTIEGLMPPLMEIFASGDEVVRFAPAEPEDVAAAEQETDYVNHVFMQQNNGFLVLYSFIKDALLSKVGVVKVWWECRTEVERETYLDQPDDAFALIVAQPGVEIVEHTERDAPLVARMTPAQAGGNPGLVPRGETAPDVAGAHPGTNRPRRAPSCTMSPSKSAAPRNAPGSRASRPRSSASAGAHARSRTRTIASTTCSARSRNSSPKATTASRCKNCRLIRSRTPSRSRRATRSTSRRCAKATTGSTRRAG